MGATHQCIVKWPGWMSSKEAMGHVSSFMFGHFLLSGPKRNMYPRCGNTFWQDSMSTYQKWGGGSDPPGKQSQVIWVIFNPTFALQPRRGRRVAGSTSCARWQTLNLAMTRSAFKGLVRPFFHYAVPIVYPNYSDTSIWRLILVQNKALRLETCSSIIWPSVLVPVWVHTFPLLPVPVPVLLITNFFCSGSCSGSGVKPIYNSSSLNIFSYFL